jgi:hypothetical protein
MRVRLCHKWLPAVIAGLMFAVRVSAADDVNFSRDVRPILTKYCFKCHGPDDNVRESGLRLDVREGALQPADSGKAAIVPGHPEQSELVRRIFAESEDERMPPVDTKTQLTETQKQILKRWIQSGAEYTEHWAFVSPTRSALPKVEHQDWPRNAVDQFVLAKLEQNGLVPSPPADRFTLIRRASLDLIGLLPTPEEADAFAGDTSPNAYEALVDRLLDSPHYGERWARRWLDLARYADTNGYEKDRPRSIWPYRDWVINALNADMPFDQFTVEQVAGDMLPNATLQQRIATGFHRNTMLNEEGGIDPLEFRFHGMTDRVSTTGTTWLGLTVMCGQCHSHKYDPISQREYYQFMAFLDNADEPELDLPDPALEQRYRENLAEAERLLRDLPNHWPLETVEWVQPQIVSVSTESGEEPKQLNDGSTLFAALGPETDQYTFEFQTDATGLDRLKLEALTDDSLPNKGPGRTPHGNFVLSEIMVTAQPANAMRDAVPVKIARAEASAEQDAFPVTAAFDGKLDTGWAVHVPGKPLNTAKNATFFFDRPLGMTGEAQLTVVLTQRHGQQHTIGRVRLSLGRPIRDDRPASERRKEAIEARFTQWLARERERTVAWSPLRPVAATSNLPLLRVEPDDTVFVSGDTTKSDEYKLTFRPGIKGITALRLEALPDDRLPAHGPGMTYYEGTKGDFFLTEFQLSADGQPVKFARASESYAKNRFGNNPVGATYAIDGDPQTGWSVDGRLGERHTAVFALEQPLNPSQEISLRMTFGRHFASSLGKFRILATTDPRGGEARDLPQETEALLALPDDRVTAEQRAALRTEFLLQAPELAKQAQKIRELRQPLTGTTTLVMQERPPENPRPTHLHHRGEYLQPTEVVEPDVPAVFPPLPAGATHNRLTFARWLVSRENPLTARVTVNRQWAALFGHGLVRTPQDFGVQGEPPTHPELLDWLAVNFVDEGWSLKKLHKLIVMSATYQQSSHVTPELLERDPENKLLARGPRVRLEAEIVRDSVLAASGLLSRKIGGPSVYPPQPASVTTEGTYGAIAWKPSEGEDRYRRSLYTFSKRTAPFAMFATFDGPSGEACVARRDVSNTPLQALTLLNDVMFTEAAQQLGRTMASAPGSVEERVRELFRRCLIRPPEPEELADLVEFFNSQKQRFEAQQLNAAEVAGEGPGGVNERAAWTVLTRVLFNLDEMIAKN